MSNRRGIHAANFVSSDTHDPDANVLRAWVTDGPADAKGRMSYLYLTDAEFLAILADMAIHPRWAVAFEAAAHDVTVQEAARGTYYLGGGRDRRKALREAMAAAMARAADDAGNITQIAEA